MFFHVFSLVPHHVSLPLFVPGVEAQDQVFEFFGFVVVFSLEGLITQSMNLLCHKIHRAFVFVAQLFVRNGDAEGVSSILSVPSVITQFSDLKGLVDEKTF